MGAPGEGNSSPAPRRNRNAGAGATVEGNSSPALRRNANAGAGAAAPGNAAYWNVPPSEVAGFVPLGAGNSNAPPAVAAAAAAEARANTVRKNLLEKYRLSLQDAKEAKKRGVAANSDDDSEEEMEAMVKALAQRPRPPPGSYKEPNLREKPTAGTNGKAQLSGPSAAAGTGSTMPGGSRRKSRKTRGRRSNKHRKSRRRR